MHTSGSEACPKGSEVPIWAELAQTILSESYSRNPTVYYILGIWDPFWYYHAGLLSELFQGLQARGDLDTKPGKGYKATYCA